MLNQHHEHDGARQAVTRSLVRLAASLGGDSGQALVETALSLPMLLVVVFGIAQFGLTYNNYIMLTDAVRAGARQLSVSRGQTNACTKARDRVYASAASLNSGNLTVTMSVGGSSSGYPGTACPSNIGTTMTGGADITVTATYPCAITIYGVNYAPSCSLSSSSTVRIE